MNQEKLMSKMLEKFKQDIIFILYLSGSLFVGLSLWSFHPTDPSFNSTGTKAGVQNLCGYFGSFLSDILYQFFGYGAWALVLAGLSLSLKIIQKRNVRGAKSHFLLGTAFVFISCGLVSLYFPEKKIFSNTIYASGILGMFLTKGLISIFNKTGVSILLWSSLAVTVIFYTEKSLGDLFMTAVPHRLFLKMRSVIQSLPGKFFALFKKKARVIKNERIIENKSMESLSIVTAREVSSETTTPQESERDFIIEKQYERKEKINQESLKKIKRIENWELPKLSLLETPPVVGVKVDERTIKRNTFLLEDKLSQFSVHGQVVAVRPGPAVTMYEFKPNADVKISKITELADDLSLALSSESIRIIAPLPGRDVVGIETANQKRETVYMKEIVEDKTFWEDEIQLPIALGKEANGEPKTVDLRKMPHLLVAGTTGSGKSVFINTLLSGLLFKHSPKTLRVIIVDPKQVDLAAYHKIPHLIMPPIKEPKKAVVGLKWAVREMEKRYRSMSKFNTRGIEAFNKAVRGLSKTQISEHAAYNQELEEQNRSNTEGYYFSELPFIVMIVEEFGDLMAVDKANVEQLIVRLAQMARACGIHLVLAMQSPRRDVVTGLIKTNIPGRISFKVASKMDSRIILDDSGAERLLAQGDMLFLAPGVSKPQRHHGAWISEKEIAELTNFWAKQAEPEYDTSAMRILDGGSQSGTFDYSAPGSDGDIFSSEEGADEKYDELLAFVSTQKEVSASLLQRRFRLGYPRAARIIEIFEKEGVVGPANGSKPRQVLVSKL